MERFTNVHIIHEHGIVFIGIKRRNVTLHRPIFFITNGHKVDPDNLTMWDQRKNVESTDNKSYDEKA